MKREYQLLKNRKSRFYKTAVTSTILSICTIMLLAFILQAQANAQTTNSTLSSAQANQIQSKLLSQLQGIEFGNNKMYVGIWVLHIYSFQYTSGIYTFDMYVYFFWTDPNITTANWYLTNGYPVNSAAKILVVGNDSGSIKYEIYRVTATLSNPPDAKNYPFDQITLIVSLELLNPGYSVNLSWLQNATGVDSGFVNPIWKTTNIQLSSSEHSYPLGVVAPQVEMSITQERIKASAALSTLFPLIIFCVVSAISFLFNLKDAPSVGLRLGLNTSMLITTILFILSISNAVPPSTSISIFGMITISVIVFLALNLVVTIVGFAHFVKFKDVNWTLRINRWGFLISIILPVIMFILLFSLRA
jgi:hypothetical protein